MGQMKSRPKLWEQYHATVIDVRRRALHGVLRRGIDDR